MVRGIDKSRIFKDEHDKAQFLKRLVEIILNGKCFVFAWALMDNHVHLLFKSGEKGISIVMRKLLTGYAQYFNRRHRRRGHLFENRYKSILCDEDTYLLALIRYIHLNPVRAKVVSTLEELDHYPWSGHGMIMGKDTPEWMGVAYVLSQFGARRKLAQKAYHRFMAEGMAMGRVPELTGGGLIRSKGGWSQVLSARRAGQEREESDERILGGGDFVSGILRDAEEKARRQLKIRRSGESLLGIIEEECRRSGISPIEMKGGNRRRKVSLTRVRIVKRSLDELGISLAEIARHVGVTTSAIGKAVAHLEKRKKNNSI